jgi:hypothetical protein
MGGSSTTIGFRYFLGVQAGICIGPVDAVTQLIAGDRVAWSGNQTVSGNVDVHAPELFGGDEKEGGFSGIVEVRMGGSAQAASTYLQGRIGGPVPADRGFLSLVFRGRTAAEAEANSSALSQGSSSGSAFVTTGGAWRQWVRSAFYWTALSPYIKPVEVTVRRITAGWSTAVWNVGQAQIGNDMNPAHIIYQCLTDTVWGMGRSSALIDQASFTAAATTFANEGFGLSLEWTQQAPIGDFIQEVLRHVDAALDTDLRTGLYTLRPIRSDYVVGSLPLFEPSNTIGVSRRERALWGETVNEIIVAYTDPATETETAVVLQDLANIRIQGGVISEKLEFPGLRSAELAYRVGERELRARSTPLERVTIRTGRAAWNVRKGDAIRLTWPDYDIVELVLRVTDVDRGNIESGEIRIDAVEDVFALPATTYGASQPRLWANPAAAPAAITTARVYEVPYYELARSLSAEELLALSPSAAFPLVLAQRPANQNASVVVYQSPNTTLANFTPAGTGAYTSTALANGAVAWNTTIIPFDTVSGSDPSYFAGGYALWDDEWIAVDSVDLLAGTMTVRRGVLDSIPQPHADNSSIWFYNGENGFNGLNIDVLRAELRYFRLVGRSISGESSLAAALQLSRTHTAEWSKPYPPANVQINGEYLPAAIYSNFTLNWRGRNREAQTTALVGWTEAHIAPPVGVTYTLEVYNNATSVLLQRVEGLIAGVAGGSYVYSGPGADTLRIDFYAVAGGQRSRQTFSHVAPVTGYGYSYDNNYGGSIAGTALPRASTAPPSSALTPPPAPVWLAGAYHDFSGAVPLRSDDEGATWVSSGPSGPVLPFGCVFVAGNDRFAAYNGSGAYWIRREGGAWSERAGSALSGFVGGGSVNSITFDGTRFIMCRAEGRDLYTSTDLETWTHIGPTSSANQVSTLITARKILFVGGQYVSTGSITTGTWPNLTQSPRVATSPDLLTWSQSPIVDALAQAVYGAFFNGFYWYFAQQGTSIEDYQLVIYRSADFVTWTQIDPGVSFPASVWQPRVHVRNGQMVVLLNSGGLPDALELRTNNGTSWTIATTAFQAPVLWGNKADPVTPDSGGGAFFVRVGAPLEFGGKLLATDNFSDTTLVVRHPAGAPNAGYFGVTQLTYFGSVTNPAHDNSGLRTRFAFGGLPLARKPTSGRRYAEITITSISPGRPVSGAATFILTIGRYAAGVPSTATVTGNPQIDFSPSVGDVIGIRLDFVNSTLEIRVNNSTIQTFTGIDTSGPWIANVSSEQQFAAMSSNVGQSSFVFPQSGFTAWAD